MRSQVNKHRAARVAFCMLVAATSVALAQDTENPAELANRGVQHFNAREYFQAIQAFEAALRLAPSEEAATIKQNLASALGALGAEYFNAGESRLAEETFLKGLKHADNYYSHFGLGYLYFIRMDEARASKHLQAALVAQPDFAGTHKLLALLAYRQGQNATALERLERACRLDARDAEAKTLLKRWKSESVYLKRFKEVSTVYFSIKTDPRIDKTSVKLVLRELERAYREVGEGLGQWPERKVPIVFFREKDFHEATGSVHWVGGMYDGQLKLPIPPGDISGDRELSAIREVVRHEYAHVLVGRLASECPVWLNEGIAQHFEKTGRKDRVYRRLYENRDKRYPFKKLPARLWAVGDTELARWSYLQGLGFVEFLVEHYHEFRLRLLLGAIAEEHSVEKAFERTYGLSLEELENRWWAEVERSGTVK